MNALTGADQAQPAGMPTILTPSDGQLLMVSVSYKRRSSAARKAAAWNEIMPVDGSTVTVAPSNASGEWPPIWTAVPR